MSEWKEKSILKPNSVTVDFSMKTSIEYTSLFE